MINDPQKFSSSSGPRFGQIAIEMDFITVEQLLDALAYQEADDLAGKEHRYLGAIFLDRGHMTADQINTVLERMLNQGQAKP